MSKYDCTKTLDYAHEYRRMCSSTCCDVCPLSVLDYCIMEGVTEEHIAILQKWSDEHPEEPKLTSKEVEDE